MQTFWWGNTGKWSLGRMRSWEDNIKMDLAKICCEDGISMEMAEDSLHCQELV
jgi:hypothetical protein